MSHGIRAADTPRPGRRAGGVAAGILVAAVVLAAIILLYACDPARCSWYPPCLFHRWTGWQCPGCGSLRALHQLLHGNLAAACRLNFLTVLAIPAVGGIIGWDIFCRRTGRPGPGAAARRYWFWVALAAVVAFGVARNLP